MKYFKSPVQENMFTNRCQHVQVDLTGPWKAYVQERDICDTPK